MRALAMIIIRVYDATLSDAPPMRLCRTQLDITDILATAVLFLVRCTFLATGDAQLPRSLRARR